MKPKRYPYSGKKKQSHEEIAELRGRLSVCESSITKLRHEHFLLKS